MRWLVPGVLAMLAIPAGLVVLPAPVEAYCHDIYPSCDSADVLSTCHTFEAARARAFDADHPCLVYKHPEADRFVFGGLRTYSLGNATAEGGRPGHATAWFAAFDLDDLRVRLVPAQGFAGPGSVAAAICPGYGGPEDEGKPALLCQEFPLTLDWTQVEGHLHVPFQVQESGAAGPEDVHYGLFTIRTQALVPRVGFFENIGIQHPTSFFIGLAAGAAVAGLATGLWIRFGKPGPRQPQA